MSAATIRTTCPYCGVGCGVLARVADDGAVRSPATPSIPPTSAGLCSKGAALGETLGLDGACCTRKSTASA